MARTAVSSRPKRKTSMTATTPAPNKGLNTVDPLANMDQGYALSLVNGVATPQGVSLRQGYRKMVTGFTEAITTLIPYNSGGTSSNKLFGISGTNLYDVTTPGAVGAALVSGLSSLNKFWQYTNQTYSTANKNFLFCVNGYDSPLMYDGTSWTSCTQVASPAAPGQFNTLDNNGNAVNIANFVDAVLHQQRLWFVSKNSTKAYYCDIAQVGGKLYPIEFGPFFPRGGQLYKLASWSVNMGDISGVQQVLVAFSDKGDIAIFKGNDPSTASTWALSGTYSLGAPVGRRCTLQFESELLYLSRDGLYPLSVYLQTNSLNSNEAITFKIANLISDLADTFATTPGFELVAYPGNNLLLLNVPQTNNSNNFQLVYNTIQKGWSQFNGWAASCWCLFNNTLYFGGPDFVGLSFIGYKDGADKDGVGGNAITLNALGAFSTFDAPGRIKQPHLVKPYITTGSISPTVSLAINVDYSLLPAQGSASLNSLVSGVWDSSLWDNVNALWVGSLITYNKWTTPICYPGEALAVAISISAAEDTMWTATGWVIEPGGIFG